MMAHNINGCYKYNAEQKQGTKEHAQYELWSSKQEKKTRNYVVGE